MLTKKFFPLQRTSMDHSLSFSLFGVASFVLTTANPWVMVAAITSVTVIATVGLVVGEDYLAGRNSDRQQKNK